MCCLLRAQHLSTHSFLLFTTLSSMTQIALTGKWTVRSLLPRASIPIFTWVNPVPYLFILRTEIGGGSLISRENTLTFRAFLHYWNIFVRPACDVNNRWPQLSYDWLLCKRPPKTRWKVLLKIKDTRQGWLRGLVWKLKLRLMAPGTAHKEIVIENK